MWSFYFFKEEEWVYEVHSEWVIKYSNRKKDDHPANKKLRRPILQIVDPADTLKKQKEKGAQIENFPLTPLLRFRIKN